MTIGTNPQIHTSKRSIFKGRAIFLLCKRFLFMSRLCHTVFVNTLLNQCNVFLACPDPNAIMKDCPNPCPLTCDQPERLPCTKACIVRGCTCKDGYVYDANHKCIKPNQCRKNNVFLNVNNALPLRLQYVLLKEINK